MPNASNHYHYDAFAKTRKGELLRYIGNRRDRQEAMVQVRLSVFFGAKDAHWEGNILVLGKGRNGMVIGFIEPTSEKRCG